MYWSCISHLVVTCRLWRCPRGSDQGALTHLLHSGLLFPRPRQKMSLRAVPGKQAEKVFWQIPAAVGGKVRAIFAEAHHGQSLRAGGRQLPPGPRWEGCFPQAKYQRAEKEVALRGHFCVTTGGVGKRQDCESRERDPRFPAWGRALQMFI